MTDSTQHPFTLVVNSRDATQSLASHHSSSLSMVLKKPIHSFHEDDRICVKLISAQIPFSFYTCTQSNNKIKLSTNNTAYELPTGNYTVTSLTAALNTLLSGFTVTYDTTKMKLTITNNSDTPFSIDTTVESSARVLLGFSDTFPATLATSHTSDNVIDVTGGMRCIYMRSNIASSNVITSKDKAPGDVLAVIPISTNAGGVILYECPNPTHLMFTSMKSLTHIELSLTNEVGDRLIDTNGQHWVCELEILFIEDHPQKGPKVMGNPKNRLSYMTPLNTKDVGSVLTSQLLARRRIREKQDRANFMNRKKILKNVAKQQSKR